MGEETFEKKELLKQKGGVSKGIIAIPFLVVGIFGIGLLIGVRLKKNVAVEKVLPVQRLEQLKSPVYKEETAEPDLYLANQKTGEENKVEGKKNTNPMHAEQKSSTIQALTQQLANRPAYHSGSSPQVPVEKVQTIQLATETAMDVLASDVRIQSLQQVKMPIVEKSLLKPIKDLDSEIATVSLQNSKPEITSRITPMMENNIAYEPTELTSKKKRSRWIKILTPQSYKDIELENTIAITNLKSAVNEIEKVIVPEILITK